jgi:hypothetical protein
MNESIPISLNHSKEGKEDFEDWNLRPKTISILVTAPTDMIFQ